MRRLLVVCGVLLLVVPGLVQAATTSRLTGTVVDNENKALPGVTVTLASAVLIGGVQTQITDADGKFAFNLLPPGQYLVKTELSGFVSAEVEARVALDRATEVLIQMVLQQFADQIEVTAEAPIVDTTQVTSGQSYNEDFLKNAAVGMGGRNYLSVIGDAAGSVGTGNVNVMGSVTSDNVYLIDGLNTTDPVTATFGTNFNYDAIQEISIQTTGYEAEFGQALGGVVNLVTKSGGNQFSGSLDARYRDEKFNEAGDNYSPNVNPGSLRTISGTLGGPIIRDKLWFFVSVENNLSKSTPIHSPITRDFKGTNWIGKLTWQATDANRVILKMSSDPANIPNANAGLYVAPAAARQQDQGGKIYQVELNSVLSDAWLLTVQAGINRQNLDSYPMTSLTLPGALDEDYYQPDGAAAPNANIINYNNAQYSDRNRDEYKATVSYFLDNALGSHELKAGVGYDKLEFMYQSYTPGGQYYVLQELYNPITNPHGHGATDIDGDGYTDHQMFRDMPGAEEPKTSKGDLYTYFLQDSWRPLPNLTFKPGVRVDTAAFTNRLGQTVGDFDRVQPRIGAAWDFLGNGKSVVRANWGHFMHPGSTTLPDTIDGRAGGSMTYTGYEFFCNEHFDPNHLTLCNHDWLIQHRAIDHQEVVTVDAAGHDHYWYLVSSSGSEPSQTVDTLGVGKLKAAYSEALSVAFEQQLWAETSVSVEYVDKKTRSLMEDTCSGNAWVYTPGLPPASFDDPSTWTGSTGCNFYVINNPANLKRDYNAYIVEFETRYKGLHILGNYTWAKSKGNSEAEANQSSYSSPTYDYFPLDFYNTYGYLADDRRHRVKVNGYLLLPLDFTIGFDAFWSSKPALNTIGFCSQVSADSLAAAGFDPRILDFCASGSNLGLAGQAGFFLEPRGSNRGSSSNSQLDLSISKAFKVKSVSLEVVGTVINVFSQQEPTGYWTQPLYSAYTYGQATSWQQPRRYEVGFRVEF